MKPLLSLLSPAGSGGRLSVLIFHRVHPVADPLFPGEMHAPRFDGVCAWLAKNLNVLPLDQAVAMLAEGRLPARAAAITFDDGYADNHAVALPILQRHGLVATFFVATGFLDGGRMWNDTVVEAVRGTPKDALDLGGLGLHNIDRLPTATATERRQAINGILAAAKYLPPAQRLGAVTGIAQASGTSLPTNLMMRSEQVSALHAAGMGIGGHTVTHPILAVLERSAAREEIAAGRRRLQQLTQSPVPLFAYPNGRPGEDYDDACVALVRECGFQAAVSTAWGSARRDTDPFQLPRFTPWDRRPWRFGLRMAGNLMRAGVSQPASQGAPA